MVGDLEIMVGFRIGSRFAMRLRGGLVVIGCVFLFERAFVRDLFTWRLVDFGL